MAGRSDVQKTDKPEDKATKTTQMEAKRAKGCKLLTIHAHTHTKLPVKQRMGASRKVHVEKWPIHAHTSV